MEHKYALGKVQVTGVSKIVREAEETGMVVLERNGQGVALVVPLSWSGFGRFLKQLPAVSSGEADVDRDFHMYVRFLIDSVRTDLTRLLEPRNEERDEQAEERLQEAADSRRAPDRVAGTQLSRGS